MLAIAGTAACRLRGPNSSPFVVVWISKRVRETTLDLVERAQRGDHDAFDQLVGRYGRDLYRLAVIVIGPDLAADVTQDALIRAWRELPRLRDPERFQSWVRRILVNRCRDISRAQRRGPRIVSLDVPANPEALAASDPARMSDDRTDLWAAVSSLRVDQRTLLALHYTIGLSIAEVAETLGLPAGTVKSRLNAALGTLRVAMSVMDR